jgi:Tol biopolymer transport system component
MMRGARLLACAAIIAGCDHGAPFTPALPAEPGPFAPGVPARLTFNGADDRTVSWLPDGSAFIYSSEELEDPADHDRCLLIMPSSGGTVSRSICEQRPGHQDSTDVFQSPVVSAGGRLLYLRAVSRIGNQKSPRMELALATLDEPVPAPVVTPVPYFANSGKTHSFVASPAWLDDEHFVYLAQYLWYQGSTFLPDTFATGLEIVHGSVTGDAATLTVVPATEDASSVSAGDQPGTVVATFGGDSKVYRVDLATGARSELWDFGAAGIARDAQVVGDRLVAIVGRSVLYQFEDAHQLFVQRDEGGDLHVVELSTGETEVFSSDETLFRRPALAPDGSRLVVEASPFAPVHVGPVSDYNAFNHRGDLWLITFD